MEQNEESSITAFEELDLNSELLNFDQTVKLGKIYTKNKGNGDYTWNINCYDVDDISVPLNGEWITFQVEYDLNAPGYWDWTKGVATVYHNGGSEGSKSEETHDKISGTWEWNIQCEPGDYIEWTLYARITDWWGTGSMDIDTECSGVTDIIPPGCHFVLSPIEHDFGEVFVGETEDFSFTLENEGDSGSGNIKLTGSDAKQFYLPDGGSFSLGSGESMQISVEYIPDEVGFHYATLEINGDSPCNSVSASLEGEGKGEPTSELKITFPKVGYVSIGEVGIPVSILEILGVGVYLSSDLTVKATASSDIDKVKFIVEGIDKTDNSRPFETTFNDVSNSFTLLTIEAIGYENNVEKVSRSLSSIVYYPLI